MTNEERARDLLGEVLKCGGTANGKIVLATALREAEARGLERGAEIADEAFAKWKANADRPQSEHSGPSYAAAVAGEAASRDIAASLRAEAARVREGKP